MSEPDTPTHRYTARLAGEIEAKWQDRWEADGTFHAPNPTGSLGQGFEQVAERPKLYVNDMFPYPSGAGLHVGHPLGYIGTDVYARFMRMRGRNVLHAMGYDAFGLPAEQYAVQTGQHPRITTEANIATMRRQLRALGLGHDDRRSVSTTDVAYYRWTQWIFLQLYGSWYDRDEGRARPVADLVTAFASGGRAPRADANPDGVSWADLDDERVPRSSTNIGSRTSRKRRSTGVPRSARCSRTKRSPRTGGAIAATIPSSSGRSSSGCCASPNTPTACSTTSICSTGPSRSSSCSGTGSGRARGR